MKGLVIKNTGSWYTVLTDDGQLIDCKIKGTFRLKGIRSTNPVAVGDRVEVSSPSSTVSARAQSRDLLPSFITSIDDRRNYIVRRSQNLSKQSHILAANVDQAFLLVTVNYPPDLHDLHRPFPGIGRSLSRPSGSDLQQDRPARR